MAGHLIKDPSFVLVCTALDPDFYLRANPDVAAAGADPFAHYAEVGWREGRDPAPWFSSAAYLEDHPDVAASGGNPLAHFLRYGADQGARIRPSMQMALRESGTDAQSGWTYRPTQPGIRMQTVAASFEAYEPVTFELPSIAPVREAVDQSAPEEAETTEEGEILAVGQIGEAANEVIVDKAACNLVTEAFDRRFYLAENPDVASSDVDPLTHFMECGWREGRDPAPWFSVSDYMELNPDVAASSIPPFVHYLQAGRQEGRLPRLELGFRYRILAALQPLEARVEAAEVYDKLTMPGDIDDLSGLLADSRSGLRDLHLTFSHDDYSTNLGGVQLCLQREDAAAAASGRDHLHIYPVNSRPLLRRPGHGNPVGLVWNGVPAGVFSVATLTEGLETRLADVAPGRRSLAIHSLLGHSVSDVLAIVRAAGMNAGWFWVHDFASVCASYHLLRNDVADCGAPPVGSPACGICVYGGHRQFHLDEHARLFQALDLSVAAPSQAALDTWQRGSGLSARQMRVAPLATLAPRGVSAKPAETETRPFRLAFPGLPSPLKGWLVFRDLVLRFAQDPRYEFLHLARDPAAGLPLAFHPVTVTPENPKAMQARLEDLQVDAVMVWSLCRETFSFTTHEAAAAGAAILTGPDSGNVAAFVQATGLGEVIADEAALFELFESGEILRLSRAQRKPALADLVHSRLTIDLLDGEAVR